MCVCVTFAFFDMFFVSLPRVYVRTYAENVFLQMFIRTDCAPTHSIEKTVAIATRQLEPQADLAESLLLLFIPNPLLSVAIPPPICAILIALPTRVFVVTWLRATPLGMGSAETRLP